MTQPVNEKLTLLQMRERSHISATDAARETGVTYRALRNWEQARNVPSVLHTDALLRIYGFTWDDLSLEPFELEKQRRECSSISP